MERPTPAALKDLMLLGYEVASAELQVLGMPKQKEPGYAQCTMSTKPEIISKNDDKKEKRLLLKAKVEFHIYSGATEENDPKKELVLRCIIEFIIKYKMPKGLDPVSRFKANQWYFKAQANVISHIILRDFLRNTPFSSLNLPILAS